MLPQYQRFDSSGVAVTDRFEYWRSWYSEAVDAKMHLDPVDRQPADFDSSAEVLRFGEITLTELRCGPAVGRWTRETTEAYDLFRVIVFLQGREATGFWHGREVSLADGHPVLHGPTGGWWRAPAGLHTIQVNVPRALLDTPGPVLDRFADRQPLGESAVFAALLRPMLLGAVGNLRVFADHRENDLSALWLTAVMMLVRSLSEHDLDGAELFSARRLLAERFIDSHLGDPALTPEAVAAALHVSRRTLYRSLATDGPGIAALIRERRLSRADAMLRDPRHGHRLVSQIAAEVGFPSAARFSRLFRARFGRTPRECRADAATTGRVVTGSVPRGRSGLR